jgi:hypoxanthine-guanine phosphoribosyltransferase
MIPDYDNLITYKLECLPEDLQIEGNCSAVDEETDREVAQWIRDQLDAGNDWAWCLAKVTATLEVDGHTFVGVDYLGCCSYKNEADFREPGGYFDSMKQEARARLIEHLRDAVDEGKTAQEILDRIDL